MKIVRCGENSVQVYNSNLGFVRTINLIDSSATESTDPGLISDLIANGERVACPIVEKL